MKIGQVVFEVGEFVMVKSKVGLEVVGILMVMGESVVVVVVEQVKTWSVWDRKVEALKVLVQMQGIAHAVLGSPFAKR